MRIAIPADICLVKDVLVDLERGVYLEVELAHYSRTATDPLVARALWCSSYHGPEFGAHWVPKKGQHVLCLFPGFGAEGGAGGDLDEGYAFAVVPGEPVPPPEGLDGDLSEQRAILKTRSGEIQDVHVQADVKAKVDGDLDLEVVGDLDLQADDGDVSFLGSLVAAITDLFQETSGSKVETVQGTKAMTVGTDYTRTVTGLENSTNVGPVARIFQAAVTWLGSGILSFITSGQVTLESTAGDVVVNAGGLVKLGGGGKFLLTEDLYAWLDTHVHSGVESGTDVSGPIIVSASTVPTTQNVKAS